MVSFEDDVIVKPWATHYLQTACDSYNFGTDLMLLSRYMEVTLTSLQGARRLTARLRQYGIRRNDDQQLMIPGMMNHVVQQHKHHMALEKESRPWKLGRKTNQGDITSSNGMTWHEMALLRLLTLPQARSLPSFGNPVPLPPLRCKH